MSHDRSSHWSRKPGRPLLSDLGEMEILERIRGMLAGRTGLLGDPRFVSVGVGDDAALIRPRPGTQLAWTCDVHVEGRHFRTADMTPEEVGRRVAVGNLSDLAAMASRPRAALLSLALPSGDPEDVLMGLLAGAATELEASGGVVAGGNLSATTGPRVIDGTFVGEVEGAAILRSGARPDDLILLIGRTGESAAGLWVLNGRAAGEAGLRGPAFDGLAQAYRRPEHKVAEALILREAGGVTALIDTSDGLIADLSRLCSASGVGARVEAAAIPVSARLQEAARSAGADAFDWVFGPSDDYALIAAVVPDHVKDIQSRLGERASVIGRFHGEPNGVAIAGWKAIGPPPGWDHFRRGS